MTLQEFKAWFEGFTENMSGAPNKDQWKRIRARVGEIDGVAITEKVFIERYWPYYPYTSPWLFTTCSSASSPPTPKFNLTGANPTYTSNLAMYTLGVADNAVGWQGSTESGG
jgi:hypothetical protein